MHFRRYLSILASLIFVAFGTTGKSAAAGASATGTVSASLTTSGAAPDGGLADVIAVNITIDEIRVHTDTEDPDARAADEGEWTVLCTDVRTYDLLAAGGTWVPLCNQVVGGTIVTAPIDVPAGRISQIRLHVVSAELVFGDGSSAALEIPGGTTRGLTIDVDREIPSGGSIDIQLDFHVQQSIHKADGRYVLRPVIQAR